MPDAQPRTGRRLLLLAHRFPYNHGEVAAESYLETEIGYLAEAFDEVWAVGTEAPKGDKPTCGLPANVRPVALGCAGTRAAKGVLALTGQLLALSNDEEVQEALAAPGTGTTFAQGAFARYFVQRARRKLAALRPLLREEGLEPTHIYSFWFYDTALTGAWLKDEYPCARVFARAHRYDLYEGRSRVGRIPARECLLQRLDAVFPCSEDGSEYLRARYPQFASKVRTSYLGTRDLPDKSGEPAGPRLQLLSCSRVVPVKRVGLILDALELLDAQGAEIDWTHYGDGLERAGLCQRAAGLKSVTATFPGNLPNAELLEEYAGRHFDLFVNVSESEGLPISVMEACGCGIPVLATDVGGTSEVVHDGENGFLLPADVDAEQLAARIEGFAAMPVQRREGLRAVSRSAWERDFRAEANVRALLSSLLDEEGE